MGTNIGKGMNITDRQTGWRLMMTDSKGNIRGAMGPKIRRMDSPGFPALTLYISLPLSSFSAIPILVIKLLAKYGGMSRIESVFSLSSLDAIGSLNDHHILATALWIKSKERYRNWWNSTQLICVSENATKQPEFPEITSMQILTVF